METKITLANQSQEINIIPQEGYEIDLEKSDLKNGKVIFKEVEKKYSSEFYYSNERHGETIDTPLSETYAEKLEILDTLLCLRDEYNRIDGFTEGFNIGRKYWCIDNFENKINLSTWSAYNKIMYFRKEETAKLFLKNFKEQLETVKEFL